MRQNSNTAFAGVKPLPGFCLCSLSIQRTFHKMLSRCRAGFSDQELDSAFEVNEAPPLKYLNFGQVTHLGGLTRAGQHIYILQAGSSFFF